MARVSGKTVLQAALNSGVRKPIVIGVDSHGKQYVAAAGRIKHAGDLDDYIARIAAASSYLRRVRAKALRKESRARTPQ